MGAGRSAWKLIAGDEWVSRDPFGQVKPADLSNQTSPMAEVGSVSLRAPRNGYTSFRLWAIGAGDYRLSAAIDGPVEVDLYRAWYHRMADPKKAPRYWVDALIPTSGDAQQLPDPDNQIPDQTHQEFWVDLFAPADAAVGPVRGQIVLLADGESVELPLIVEIIEAVLPDEPTIVCDHNSYGRGAMQTLYPRAFDNCVDDDARSAKTIELLHHYYRICHEHRGLFSNLGAGHAGSCDRIYGPSLCGSGHTRNLGDWTWFDRYHGPVLDGTIFEIPSPGMPRPRRPAVPPWGVYTPITPDWPADYLWWGQPGYEVEFTQGIEQFDRHFREKSWTRARPSFFFNHKKRYRWYEWDGDEPKYAKDDSYVLEMGRMFRKAIGDSPVPWVFRMDASWRMKKHFEHFSGLIDFWVCGGFSSWYLEEISRVVARGDTVWTYSGTPPVDAPSAALLEHVLRTWARGINGHVEWLTIVPGRDPWFACDGAATGMIYPGERFGIAGPIPSIRLKLQRNGIQDIDLIDARARETGRVDAIRAELAQRAGVSLWETPPAAVRELPPEEWDSRNLSGGQDENMDRHVALDPRWWVLLRRTALGEEALP